MIKFEFKSHCYLYVNCTSFSHLVNNILSNPSNRDSLQLDSNKSEDKVWRWLSDKPGSEILVSWQPHSYSVTLLETEKRARTLPLRIWSNLE